MFDRVVQGTLETVLPDVLYHYTTWAGTEGIISSRQFWATSHDCTNDLAELVSADSIIVEVVKGLRANATKPTLTVLETFLENYADSQVTRVIPVYLVCFSALRDDEEQWRKYADNGRGFCLGTRVVRETPPENSDTRAG